MTRLKIERANPYSAAQIYALVADVARYQEFVPYCTTSHCWDKTPDGFSAELRFGYKQWEKGFISKVETFADAKEIRVRKTKGPFRHLDVFWRFVPAKSGCRIIFRLDYELNFILRRLVPPLQKRNLNKVMAVVEARADALYGKTRAAGSKAR